MTQACQQCLGSTSVEEEEEEEEDAGHGAETERRRSNRGQKLLRRRRCGQRQKGNWRHYMCRDFKNGKMRRLIVGPWLCFWKKCDTWAKDTFKGDTLTLSIASMQILRFQNSLCNKNRVPAGVGRA